MLRNATQRFAMLCNQHRNLHVSKRKPLIGVAPVSFFNGKDHKRPSLRGGGLLNHTRQSRKPATPHVSMPHHMYPYIYIYIYVYVDPIRMSILMPVCQETYVLFASHPSKKLESRSFRPQNIIETYENNKIHFFIFGIKTYRPIVTIAKRYT